MKRNPDTLRMQAFKQHNRSELGALFGIMGIEN